MFLTLLANGRRPPDWVALIWLVCWCIFIGWVYSAWTELTMTGKVVVTIIEAVTVPELRWGQSRH